MKECIYHNGILDLFGNGPAPSGVTRSRFLSLCVGEKYKEEGLLNGYEDFQDMQLPLFER
jgi:hypothetical protein